MAPLYTIYDGCKRSRVARKKQSMVDPCSSQPPGGTSLAGEWRVSRHSISFRKPFCAPLSATILTFACTATVTNPGKTMRSRMNEVLSLLFECL